MENLNFTNQENYILTTRLSVYFEHNGREYDAYSYADGDGLTEDPTIIDCETGLDETAFFLYDAENGEEILQLIEDELLRILNDVKPTY